MGLKGKKETVTLTTIIKGRRVTVRVSKSVLKRIEQITAIRRKETDNESPESPSLTC